jgi:hypothetical protein
MLGIEDSALSQAGSQEWFRAPLKEAVGAQRRLGSEAPETGRQDIFRVIVYKLIRSASSASILQWLPLPLG